MEQAELEVLVSELETRVERLRTLYDMYFMGIEKLEPLVPKKDVERRIAVLRKEQIRNTGLRFRFQTVIQRFNTYQTYWLRISRQIEQGTYARDVRRAAARFGVDPARERVSSPPASSSREEREAQDEAPVYELSEEDLAPESGDPALLVPAEVPAEQDPFAPIAAPPPQAAPSAQRVRRAPGASVAPPVAPVAMRFELDEIADPFEEVDPFPKPVAPAAGPVGPALRIAKRPAAPESPPEEGWPRDTERRMPVVAPAPARPAAEGGRVVIAKRASMPDEMERAPASARVAPAGAAVGGPGLSRAAAPPLAGAPAAAPSGPRLNAPSVAEAPGGSRAPVGPPPPSSRRPGASSGAASATPAHGPAFGGLARPPIAASPKSSGAVPPPAAPRERATAPRAVAPKAPAANVGDMSGDRFGEVFSKYVETRRKHNEPTHAITRDALAKQLAESTQRLKQKHGGKAIDFEVVVKDGKTILRPVVK